MEVSGRKTVERLELEAVDAASIYEDVVPALSELETMGIKMFIASSLSSLAIARFLQKIAVQKLFTAVWNRDNAGGIKAEPLRRAVAGASLKPEHTMFL